MAAKKKLRSYHWFGGPGIDSMVRCVVRLNVFPFSGRAGFLAVGEQ